MARGPRSKPVAAKKSKSIAADAAASPAAAKSTTAAGADTPAAADGEKKKKKTSTTSIPAAPADAAPAAAVTKGKSKAAAASAADAQLIDRRVSPAQALKAIHALNAHREKRTSAATDPAAARTDDLLPNAPTARDDALFLQFSLKRLPTPASSTPFPKPAQIPLPHPLLSADTASVCLIVKDPQREYKDLLTSLNIRSIARVVGVTKLKGKFAPFDARRQLMNDHDLFLVDERVVGLMPKLLGKKWMESKKPPIPVKLTHTRHLAAELDRAIGSTYYLPTRGSCLTVRLGSLVAHTPQQLLDNLQAAIPAVVQRFKPIDAAPETAAATKAGAVVPEEPLARSRWNNVQALELKTGSSMALPIWTSSLAERWVGMEEASAKATEVREAKAAKRAAKAEKDAAKKKRKLLKGAQAIEAAMESSAEEDDDDDDAEDDEDGDEE